MNGINAAITEIDVLTSAVADAMAEVTTVIRRDGIESEDAGMLRHLVEFVVEHTDGIRRQFMTALDSILVGWNEIIQKKTGTKAYVPCSQELLQILEKYNYSVPRLTDQKINEYIKEVAKMAGLDEEIRVEYVKGGQKHVDFVPKWKMVHSHTARRTGATLMYLSGMEIYDIMKITGHTSPLMLKRYIKADELEVVQKIVEKYNYFD